MEAMKCYELAEPFHADCQAIVEPTTYRKKTEGGVTSVYQKILGQLYWRLG